MGCPESIDSRDHAPPARLVMQDIASPAPARRAAGRRRGFVGIDFETALDDAALTALVQKGYEERLVPSDFHPDAWQPVVIRDPEATPSAAGAGRRRQVQLPRAGRLHRADHSARCRPCRMVSKVDARRPAARAGLPRVLAGAAGRLRRPAVARSRERARRRATSRTRRHHRVGGKNVCRSIRPASSRASRRSATSLVADASNGRAALPARPASMSPRLREPGRAT